MPDFRLLSHSPWCRQSVLFILFFQQLVYLILVAYGEFAFVVLFLLPGPFSFSLFLDTIIFNGCAFLALFSHYRAMTTGKKNLKIIQSNIWLKKEIYSVACFDFFCFFLKRLKFVFRSWCLWKNSSHRRICAWRQKSTRPGSFITQITKLFLGKSTYSPLRFMLLFHKDNWIWDIDWTRIFFSA